MEKIRITIPDGLNPQEEIFAIAKKLGKSLAPKSQKAIGNGYEVKHLETQIIITREPVEKLTVTMECSVCHTIFEPSLGKPLYVNYGGTTKKRMFCSDHCRDMLFILCGEGRASIKKSGLKFVGCR